RAAQAEAAQKAAQAETARARPPERPPTPAPALEAPARPSAGGGTIAGRFALQENAYAVRDQYRSQNIRASVEQVNTGGRPMYQVRIWR
ncbi:MAG TPA: SPOR domain-containing protein, partial [Candidatus Competibacteraceae bacterium]|nr:SPOR domain-containing protein [Candidatus Competibacteraceae bacterium]